MNCTDCQARLADLSAEALASDQTLAMREHFEECSHCYQEWAVFEHTLFLVSSLQQPLPTPLASEQMWHRCSEHIFQKVEAERLNRPQNTGVPLESSSGWRGWLQRQPRWSWASLAGAFVLFGAVWFLSPDDNAVRNENFPSEGQLIALENKALQNPPAMAAGLINHHSAMAIDPFTDYVGTTLVSYSATSPSSGVATGAPRR